MDKNFWDTRYSDSEYAYGKEPNDFLKSKSGLIKLNSKILCLAEGEGRNAVFLAELGHDVTAIDYSKEGLNKLKNFASSKNLIVHTICIDLNDYKIEAGAWDAIICFPNSLRTSIFKQVYNGLKEDGVFF